MYRLEGSPYPDYTTIARFKSLHFVPVSENLMAQFTEILTENGEITMKNLFVDGTKFEAYETYKDDEKLSPLVRELSWSNNLEIFSRAKSVEAFLRHL